MWHTRPLSEAVRRSFAWLSFFRRNQTHLFFTISVWAQKRIYANYCCVDRDEVAAIHAAHTNVDAVIGFMWPAAEKRFGSVFEFKHQFHESKAVSKFYVCFYFATKSRNVCICRSIATKLFANVADDVLVEVIVTVATELRGDCESIQMNDFC